LLGGKPAPAVGFAIGVERLLDLWAQTKTRAGADDTAPECEVYVVHQGEAAQRRAACLAEDLRDAGLSVIVHAGSTSTAGFKAQFKRADASGARVAVIIGDAELASQTASVKDLASGAQQQIAFDRLAATLVQH